MPHRAFCVTHVPLPNLPTNPFKSNEFAIVTQTLIDWLVCKCTEKFANIQYFHIVCGLVYWDRLVCIIRSEQPLHPHTSPLSCRLVCLCGRLVYRNQRWVCTCMERAKFNDESSTDDHLMSLFRFPLPMQNLNWPLNNKIFETLGNRPVGWKTEDLSFFSYEDFWH